MVYLKHAGTLEVLKNIFLPKKKKKKKELLLRKATEIRNYRKEMKREKRGGRESYVSRQLFKMNFGVDFTEHTVRAVSKLPF